MPPYASPTPSFTASLQSAPCDWQAEGTEVVAGPAKGVWSEQEHNRFLDALKQFPQGPWKAITEYVGTRSIRQVQTHAQKYQEKVQRRARGLKTSHPRAVKRDHRIDADVEQWWNRESAMLAGSPSRPRTVSRRRRRQTSEDTDESVNPDRAYGVSGSTQLLSRELKHEDSASEDEQLSHTYESRLSVTGANLEPLPLQHGRTPTSSMLPTLEECLAVVNECLVEPASSSRAYFDNSAVGMVVL